MTPSQTLRAALAAGLLLALTGCGGGDKPRPDDKGDKKGGPNPDPKADPKADPKVEPKTEPKPEKLDLSSPVVKDAIAFLTAVGGGAAKADQLSAGFVRLVGQPAELPSDQAMGYSPSAAEGWLRAVGSKLAGMGPMTEHTQAGDVAVFRGPFTGGTYFLRMVREAGGWKADWLSLSSAKVTGPPAAADPDGVLRGFAAAAVAAAVCDRDAMPAGERVAVVAAGLTPALRAQLGEPFASDKALGYNPTKLRQKVQELGGGAEAVALTPHGGDGFRAEVTGAGGAKAVYLVAMDKGTTPGQWLVSAVAPQK